MAQSMSFNEFYEVIRWLLLPAIGGLFFLIWKLNDNQRTYIKDGMTELRESYEKHNTEDDVRHREVTVEVGALRQQMTAFQIEVAKNYVTMTAMGQVETGLRKDITEIKGDVKELLKLLITGNHHDSRG